MTAGLEHVVQLRDSNMLESVGIAMRCPCNRWDLEVPSDVDRDVMKGVILAHRRACIVFASEAMLAGAT